MPARSSEQTAAPIVGVDVGGTFTDLVLLDGSALRVVKLPSTPPAFHRAVIDAVSRARPGEGARMIHGSTVATNALLQRAGEPVAFVTTHGFRDMLLIGRQNRPKLYALEIKRSPPITPEENWFTVRERIDAKGGVIEPLDDAEITQLIESIHSRGLKHVAVCFLFSFVNPAHERQLGRRLSDVGFTVSLSCDVLPEFREYERASTTTINASLRPIVAAYLEELSIGLPASVSELRITQSGGGTLSTTEAAAHAAKLVLSGPAGGVMGAAFVAREAGLAGDVISYDMGGTSTDVALIAAGKPQWTTSATIDGLPIGLPMFDIHTVGAGGGSIAYRDLGGALRVGPRSAGAHPGPACYGRGGAQATVTDANLVLGRIIPDQFLAGSMNVDVALARDVIGNLARALGKDVTETALGIVRVAEANMAAAVRAITSRRGHDPRQFSLVSFGGAGGLHACAVAAALEIPRVIIPPYAGVLSALGMVVAAPVVDVARTVVHRGADLNDAEIEAEFAQLAEEARRAIGDEDTRVTEYFADARFRGQSHELKVAISRLAIAEISRRFHTAYRAQYGRAPHGRAVEIVTLRLRHIGYRPDVHLPRIAPAAHAYAGIRVASIIDAAGASAPASVLRRDELVAMATIPGPLLIIDPEATTFVPTDWVAKTAENGVVTLARDE